MINREFFFSTIKSHTTVERLHNILRQSQVDGYENILYAWDQDSNLTDHRHLAYILATVYHETAATIQPIEEYGKGKNKPYGIPDPRTGKAYYGRGYVQITWYDNYKKFEDMLSIPLLAQPELACKPDVACDILFAGMLNGMFTGKKLSHYFSGNKCDPYNARRIINGTDCADKIATYFRVFLNAISNIPNI